MKRTATDTIEGAALMARLEEMRADHEQRIVTHLSPVQLHDLLDYIETHDRLAHTHLLPSTLDFIRTRLTL